MVNFKSVRKMDMVENEDNKYSIVTLQDFPFICRICCKRRSDLRLFEEEGYLFDLFQTIRKIDVGSGIEFPKNICNDCINKLQNISLFVDSLKSTDASFGKNVKPKKDSIQYTNEIDSEVLRVSTRTEENMPIQEFQTCRICLSPASTLTSFEDKKHLIELLKNIGVKDEFGTSEVNGFCQNCDSKLENISLLIFSSSGNDQKLANARWTNNAIKTENDSNPTDCESSTRQEFQLESSVYEDEAVAENMFEKNSFCESRVKLENIDIKEEIIDSELATHTEQDYRNGLKICYQSLPDEKATDVSTIMETLQEESLSFPNERNLDSDMDLTTQSDKTPFGCDYCEKNFSTKWYFQQHMLTHTSGKPFKCDCCRTSFTTAGSLKRHMLIHTGKKPFKCDCCGKSFTRAVQLKKHILIHTRERHMLAHSGEKPFRCGSCEKSFTRMGNLNQHMLTHSGKCPFRCGCCERSFSLKANLKRHILIHTGERPFKCDCCEKQFIVASDLKRHMLTHTGKKPFKCDCCEKSFTQVGNLKQHMLTHSRKKPFRCGCCEKSFSQKSNLKKHMLSHTGPSNNNSEEAIS